MGIEKKVREINSALQKATGLPEIGFFYAGTDTAFVSPQDTHLIGQKVHAVAAWANKHDAAVHLNPSQGEIRTDITLGGHKVSVREVVTSNNCREVNVLLGRDPDADDGIDASVLLEMFGAEEGS